MRTPLKTLDHPDQSPSPSLEGDGGVDFSGEAVSGSGRADRDKRESYVGYEPRRTRFQSRWAPWSWSGSGSPEERSRSPERRDYSNWRSHEGDHEEEGAIKEVSDSPPTPTPAAVFVAHEPAFRVSAGLRNLGNTCFMNAVLQCLVHTRPLVQGLSMIKHYTPCFSDEFCLVCALREHVSLSFSLLDVISPYKIADNLKYFSPDFVRYHQEDAHEFLQCMLNKLEKYPICSEDPFSVTPSDNLVKQVFGGSLVSRLQCSQCNHISCTPEDLIDFSLEIGDISTLDGALDSFTKLEKIEDIKLTCDRCNEKVLMEKQLIVDKAPLVASFHLKRFKNDGITVEKISKHVEYPLSLNLHPYIVSHSEDNAGLIYDLYAVVVHSGYSSNSGHYVGYVRSSPSTWHEFDDSVVTRVGESYVLSQEAYILFYAKHENSWFSNDKEVQSLCHSTISPISVLDNGNLSSESDYSTENQHKCDIPLSRHQESGEAACQPACSGSQQANIEVRFENKGHGKYSDLLLNGEDDKDEVVVDDFSFNFEMLLNGEDKENKTRVVDTNDSSLNCDMLKDEARNEEAGNLTNNNTIRPRGDSIQSPSSQAASTGSLEAAKVEKRVLRKRPAAKPTDDPRNKQVLKSLKRTNMNMPMSRAKNILACLNLNGSPNKKNEKALLHPPVYSRKSDRLNSSVRSAIFR
ncbi:unnamed protein product [Rhodiola kirilowii]